jgi:hypothetical protein
MTPVNWSSRHPSSSNCSGSSEPSGSVSAWSCHLDANVLLPRKGKYKLRAISLPFKQQILIRRFNDIESIVYFGSFLHQPEDSGSTVTRHRPVTVPQGPIPIRGTPLQSMIFSQFH